MLRAPQPDLVSRAGHGIPHVVPQLPLAPERPEPVLGLIPPAALFRDLEAATGVVLAVSGGPDSTALMNLAGAWAAARGRPQLTVASVDHGLRCGSGEAAARVVKAAVELGLPGRVLVWAGPKPQRAIQERARNARYALLTAFAHEISASHLVTAHTLDDQAETLLFRLARGSGPTGLRGMAVVAERDGLVHSRPFLATRKAALLEACRTNGWAFDEDPANENAAFARTRWRLLMPLLATEGLTAERLGRLAARLTRADEALDLFAAEVCAATELGRTAEGRIFTSTLIGQPEEIIVRVLASALVELSGKGQIRLGRLESLVAEIVVHSRRGESLRRTLHHCRVILKAGRLTVRREAPRRSGVGSGV